MLRLETTLDHVVAFLTRGQALPKVTLASTRDAVHGTDLRELTPDEWPLVAVRALDGRVGEHVTVVFDPVASALRLPERGEMTVVMLRWKDVPIAPEARAGGEHHVQRQQRKAAASRFEELVREAQRKPRRSR